MQSLYGVSPVIKDYKGVPALRNIAHSIHFNGLCGSRFRAIVGCIHLYLEMQKET